MYRFTIGIENLQFYAQHGFYPQEQIIGTTFRVDVYIHANVLEAAQQDELNGTVDYQKVFAICKSIMNQPAKTLEHLALTIANQVWELNSQITEVTARVTKAGVPVQGIQVAQTYAEVKKTA